MRTPIVRNRFRINLKNLLDFLAWGFLVCSGFATAFSPLLCLSTTGGCDGVWKEE